MLNIIWVAMVLGAVVYGACANTLPQVAKALVDSAAASVTLALGLVGVMTLWLGLMRVLHEAGVMQALARLLRPIMRRLFQDVPADNPAMGMMILNITANILGLGNIATPFGLKAMQALNRLNPHPGTASNAMVLFLTIKTSGLSIFPTDMIALRASLGATAPGSIFLTTLIATCVSAMVGICVVKLTEQWPIFAIQQAAADRVQDDTPIDTNDLQEVPLQPLTGRKRLSCLLLIALVASAFVYAFVRDAHTMGLINASKNALNTWPLVILLVLFILLGIMRGVNIYNAVVQGGREGFDVALRIIPYLVAMLVAIGMLRESGAINMLIQICRPFSESLGMPAEVLPMALLRPLSGTGAYAVAADIMKIYGPDSLIGNMVSTIMGSTETTFYVLALYFGVVQIRNIRHTLVCCLTADIAGVIAAVWVCRLLFNLQY